jgi:TPR repeat protein
MVLSLQRLLGRRSKAASEADVVDWLAHGISFHESRQYLKALDAWKKAAGESDPEAAYRIGLLYASGEGVLRSVADAAAWYKEAAKAGHTEAQYCLGQIYLHGSNGGPPESWFAAACEFDSEAAARAASVLFPNGIAVEKNLDEAMHWTWAAATAGKVEAQALMGEFYRRGHGCAQDYGEALRWFWLAAQQGVSSAQFAMGDFFYQGLGVEVDHAMAADWYEKAAEGATCGRRSHWARSTLRVMGVRPIRARRRDGLFRRPRTARHAACTTLPQCS